MKTNTLLTALALALCLGITPQAQGMGYFKAAYNSAYFWGQKTVTSAINFNKCVFNRLSNALKAFLPSKTNQKPDAQNLAKLSTVLKPSTNNNALKRASVLVNHIAPEQPAPYDNEIDRAEDYEPYTEEEPKNKESLNTLFKEYITRNYQYLLMTQRTSSILTELINNEIGTEEVFDTQDNLAGTLYFHRLELEDRQTLSVVRMHNSKDELIGFCFARANLATQEGFIDYLLVSQDERKNGYGKVLLAHIYKMLCKDNCTKIAGHASSFDLKDGESKDSMQPKLEAFYGQFGAVSTDGTKANLGVTVQ